ncbi:MAG: tRNA methyltransferase [Candidatus Aenigmatarchaeota archaeon]|nr:MAG: tRNA methyltransferase [Candidatus Aenigmarchaeota archaeon]
MLRKDDFVLLLSEKRTYLVQKSHGKLHTEFGVIDLTKIKKYGQSIRTHKGVLFLVVKPTLSDMMKKLKRMPQVVTAKDAAAIVAHVGIRPGWKCVDAGAGSAFLALMIGNVVGPRGKVVSYESNKKFAEVAKQNVKKCGLEKIVKIKNKPVEKMNEKGLDLITLDIRNVDQYIEKMFKALKPGGWLVVYSPYIEQVISARKVMQTVGFAHITTKEVIEREWQSDYFSRPKTRMLGHTGFLTFARKVSKKIPIKKKLAEKQKTEKEN